MIRKRRDGRLLRGPARHSLLSKGPKRKRRKRRRSDLWGYVVGIGAALGIVAYWYIVFGVVDPAHERQGPAGERPKPKPDVVVAPDVSVVRPPPIDVVGESIVRTAEGMVARGVRWESGYVVMDYPGGDLPPDQGTSVDILVRALRGANIDLQRLIHEDRQRHPEHYPLHRWKRKTPDPNIDHRRLANVWAFFNRYAVRLDAGTGRDALESWKAGDVVFWGEGSLAVPTHVGIVTGRRTSASLPYVIDLHRDDGTISDQHLLTDRPIMGHFRVDVDRLPEPGAPMPSPGRPLEP